MEEDIKILKEKITNGTIYVQCGFTIDKAIENILNRLEQLEKELEPIHKLGIPVEVLVSEFDRLENLEDDRVRLKAELEKLEKENKELKISNAVYVKDNDYLMGNSIPKFAIKKKIEELEKNENCTYCNNTCNKYLACKCLKEILGEE